MPRGAGAIVFAALLGAATATRAQVDAPKAQDRSTGLPGGLAWTFNFDATWGTFGFGNSLVTNPKEGVGENLSDQWFEGSMKPGLTGRYTFASSAVLSGRLSAVGERTYGSAPSVAGSDYSSFQVEDLAIGWRSGSSIGSHEDALELTVGRAPYSIGHGMLLYDGAAEGGSRGGYWTNARKAWQFAAVARARAGAHTIEAFYLDRDELPAADTGSRAWGANYELHAGESNTFGATYMKWLAHADQKPGRDGLDLFNARAYTSPLAAAPGLSFELEYASERNGDRLRSDAWTIQTAYELGTVVWKPKVSYRYAFFEGDDPVTRRSEAFDPLFPGFSDWGSWWQGEIAGEYFVANSNLTSQQVRVHVTPGESIGGGLILYDFSLDQPATYEGGVSDRHLAFEMDAYTDWKINRNFTASVVLAFASPGKAVQQVYNRTERFIYGMVFLAYSY